MILPSGLSQALTDGTAILFLGAGATKQAHGPVGSELASILAAHFGHPEIPKENLQAFADMLVSLPGVDREDVDALVSRSLKDLIPSDAHLEIPRYAWGAIFTTNYDRLVEKAYDSCMQHFSEAPLQEPQVIVGSDDHPVLANPTRVPLFKLHGCVGAVGTNPLVLTTGDFKQTTKQRAQMLRVLRSLAKEAPIVFIGYSFVDGVILRLLDELSDLSPYHTHRTMYLVTPELEPGQADFFASRDIQPLIGSMAVFFETLAASVNREAVQTCLLRHLSQVRNANGQPLSIPARLRVALDSQLEQILPAEYPRYDAKLFLSGSPPTVGDLANDNDVHRRQADNLLNLVRHELSSEAYLRPVISVVGSGGAGKTTLCLRIAFELACRGDIVAFRIKAPESLHRPDVIALLKKIDVPVLLVAENLEVDSYRNAIRELRIELTTHHLRASLLVSCQKAVWNTIARFFQDTSTSVFHLDDRLSADEASELVAKLVKHKLLAAPGRVDFADRLRHILGACDGHLVVALLSLVGSDNFRDIVLSEFENLSKRAQDAYRYVALLHQHRISIPDYVLNAVTAKDWTVFREEIIKLESDLIIVQDVNYSHRRIYFRSRHPEIARVIVQTTVPRPEDRTRMYRAVIRSLGGSEEDRQFVVTLLTTKSVRDEIGDPAFLEEMFNAALDLFPEDRVLLFQLGKFETYIGNIDKGFEVLNEGRLLDPRDSYIIHQLGVNRAKKARSLEDGLVQDATFQQAQELFRLKQELDPTSHHGYTSEARLQMERAKSAISEEVRIDYCSLAQDAIRRARVVLREDEQSLLDECNAELLNYIGKPGAVVELIEGLRARTGLRYASSYHLLAVSRFELGQTREAVDAIHAGLEAFPADGKLLGTLMAAMEPHLHQADVRRTCLSILRGRQVPPNIEIQVTFVQGIVSFYEGSFGEAWGAFSKIRQCLQRKAATRMRHFLRNESGEVATLRGPVRRGTEEKFQVQHADTGYWLPIDNEGTWRRLGEPKTVEYQLGFSLAGPRATVTKVPEADV